MTSSYILAAVSFAVGLSIAGAMLFIFKMKMKAQVKRLQGLLEYESLLKETLKKEQETMLQHGMDKEAALQKKWMNSEQARKILEAELAKWQTMHREATQKTASIQEEMQTLKLKLIEAQNTIVRNKVQMEKTP